jgi:FkbM family methyltransferase
VAVTAASIVELLSADVEAPLIHIVDVGANPLNGKKGPYQPLVDQGWASLIGFEPDPDAFAKLEDIKGPGETYVPMAVGDGQAHSLRICQMSGMNSLLEPDFTLLNHLHYHSKWGRVLRRIDVPTVKLDDVAEIAAVDLLKIDIQGGELMVFQHGREKLKDCLVVQTECMFVPMYEGQPLFSEQELELRSHGLRVHRFVEQAGHVLKPFVVNGDPHGPLSQIFWVDAVFIKDFTKPDLLGSDQLIKLAVILHELYRSYDVVHLFLAAYDRRHGSDIATKYLAWISRSRTPNPQHPAP